MSINDPIVNKEELLKLSGIYVEKDSEKEIVYKFGKLMGVWNIVEISLLADYIYYTKYLIEESIERKFSEELERYLDFISDWDFYNGRGERWSYDKDEYKERIKRVFGVYKQ